MKFLVQAKFVILALILSVVIHFNDALKIGAPKIKVVRYFFPDDSNWHLVEIGSQDLFTFQNGDLIVSDLPIKIMLSCNASYPVKWTTSSDQVRRMNLVANDQRSSWTFSSWTVRYATSPTDRNAIYGSDLILSTNEKRFVGTYTCESVALNIRASSSIHVYMQEPPPPYLILAGDEIKLTAVKNSIILDCSTSQPDIPVSLFKESLYANKPLNYTQWDLLLSSNNPFEFPQIAINNNFNITFNSKTGFTISIPQGMNPSILLGNYKCITNQTDDDFVHFNVENSITSVTPYAPSGLEPFVSGFKTACLSTTESGKGIKCCSEGRNPPLLEVFPCPNPVVCDMVEPAFLSVNLSSGLLSPYTILKEDNCARVELQSETHLIKCRGEGINGHATAYPVFTGIVTHTDAAFPFSHYTFETSLQRINLRNQVIIAIPTTAINSALTTVNDLNYTTESLVYVGESIQVTCSVLNFHFSQGILWTVTLKNGVIRNHSDYEYNSMVDAYNYYDTMSHNYNFFTIQEDMVSISCHVPSWNSSDWIVATQHLKVQKPIGPFIEGPSRVQVTWTYNSTKEFLNCSVSGSPTPYVTWSKNGNIVYNSTNKYISDESNSSILYMLNISHEVEGEYICHAATVGGVAHKTFIVHVQTPLPVGPGHIIITVVSVLLLCGFALLAWRVWSQKKILNLLRRSNT